VSVGNTDLVLWPLLVQKVSTIHKDSDSLLMFRRFFKVNSLGDRCTAFWTKSSDKTNCASLSLTRKSLVA